MTQKAQMAKKSLWTTDCADFTDALIAERLRVKADDGNSASGPQIAQISQRRGLCDVSG